MRVTLSALAVVLLQISSLPSNDAFSPALSRVAKTSSPSVGKGGILYARCDNDDVDESSDTKSGVVSSILLAGAALQLSTAKVSAPKHDVNILRTQHYYLMCSLSQLIYNSNNITTGISSRKRTKCSRIIAP